MQCFNFICSAQFTKPRPQDWKNTYYEASTALHMREKKLEDAAQLIEQNLELLGASAIEDKLQDEVTNTKGSCKGYKTAYLSQIMLILQFLAWASFTDCVVILIVSLIIPLTKNATH